MEAATMMLVSAGISAAGSVVKGFSEASSQRDQASIARQQAERERARAAIEADEQRRRASAVAGADRAKRSASGVDPNSGTPLAVDAATIGEGEFGARQIMEEGELRSWRLRRESDLRRRAAQNSIIGGFVNAGTTALTAGASYAGSFGSTGGFTGSPGGSSMGVRFPYGSANSIGPGRY